MKPPLDLGEVETRRRMALSAWDVHKVGERTAKLRNRIEVGERKAPTSLKLAELKDELKALELEFDIPAEVTDWAFHIAQSLTKRGLPEGSVLQIRIPGSINLEVRLDDANEPPF